MNCPLCKARTVVNEKRGIFRDRRCTNPACGVSFTTRENVISPGASQRLCARTRDAHLESPAPAAAAANENPNPGAGCTRLRPGKGGTAAWQPTLAPRAVEA
jgi:hypothetical protein